MGDLAHDNEDSCLSNFFVASLDDSDSSPKLVVSESLIDCGKLPVIPEHDLAQNREVVDVNELEIDMSATETVTSFQDGQEVQLDDGSTALIFHHTKDSYPPELIQPVQLNNGMTAYIYRPNGNNLHDIMNLNLSKSDDDGLPASINLQTADHIEVKSRPIQVFQCDHGDCKKVYSTAHHLKVHKRTHTGEKPYVCEWKDCNKVFTTSYALKSHIRVHTGEKPYPCPQQSCTKAFKTSGDLQKHIRTHTGEKPFKCPFEGCGKAFTTSNICKVHIRTHTGERPYKCPYAECMKSFTNITNYKNHVRIHTGEKPYICRVDNCGKQFTEYSSLYKHQIVHSVAKPYACSYCGKMYRQTSTLVHHKRRLHNDLSGLCDDDYVKLEQDNSSDHAFAGYDDNLIKNRSPNPSKPSSKSNMAKSDSVVVVPMETMSSSCIMMNDEPHSQFSVLSRCENETHLEFMAQNNTETVLTLVQGEQNGMQYQPSSDMKNAHEYGKSDEGALYISEETTNPSSLITSVADSLTISTDGDNSPMWVNYHSEQQDLKRVDQQQYPVATFEIDGTKYLLQVVSEASNITPSNSSVTPCSEDNLNLQTHKSTATNTRPFTKPNNAEFQQSWLEPKEEYNNTYFASNNQLNNVLVSSKNAALSSTSVSVGTDMSGLPNPAQDAKASDAKLMTNKTTQQQKTDQRKFASRVSGKPVPILPSGNRRITVKIPRKPATKSEEHNPRTRYLLPKLKSVTSENE